MTPSVVVASHHEPALLRACLDALWSQCREVDAQLIVARAGAASEWNPLLDSFPGVVAVATSHGASVPQLRAAGLAAAEGHVVLLTEDHCVVSPGWVERLARECRQGADVAGGRMDNARGDRAIDWAGFFAEYGFFAGGGCHGGPVPLITGANVAYSRPVLPDVVKAAAQGEWENVIHADLAAAGCSFAFVPSAIVLQNRRHRFFDFCRDRFAHGRDYALRRLEIGGRQRSWPRGIGSGVLPFVLARRVYRTIPSRQRAAFLQALPWTLAFLGAWSLGEATGFLRGAGLRDGRRR